MPKDNPPSEWAGADPLGHDVYWMHREEDGQGLHSITIWHWCTGIERWNAAGVGNHTLISMEPLELSPSLACERCPWHGFIKNGRWEPV